VASLSEFAASATRRRIDAVCTQLPEELLAEVNAGLRSGIGPMTISRWLNTKGYNITAAMLGHHKREGHADD
jgi:hypothetical protein